MVFFISLFLSKHYIKHCKEPKLTLKNFYANMFSKTANAILFNLLQVRPSVPYFAVLFMSSLNVLSRYFMFNKNLVAALLQKLIISWHRSCNVWSQNQRSRAFVDVRQYLPLGMWYLMTRLDDHPHCWALLAVARAQVYNRCRSCGFFPTESCTMGPRCPS